MKNIYEILKEFGLELPAEKKADFEKAWKENYRTKAEYDNAVTKRDEYKSSLDTVNEKLKEFDEVDVKDLQSQIAKLQDDLQAKDAEYAQKEAERQFSGELSAAIKKAGGRNEKAVMARGNIVSENNDGYSVSYQTEQTEEEFESRLYQIASTYLMSSGILYMGVDEE